MDAQLCPNLALTSTLSLTLPAPAPTPAAPSADAQVKGAVSYIGCVGNDDYAKKMRKVAEEAGVNVMYMEDPAAPTGTCAVCIKGGERSLVANLGAANNYKVDHIKQPANWAVVEQTR